MPQKFHTIQLDSGGVLVCCCQFAVAMFQILPGTTARSDARKSGTEYSTHDDVLCMHIVTFLAIAGFCRDSYVNDVT